MRRRQTKKRQKLIDDHTYMVTNALRAFLRSHPEFLHLEDDLRSEGMARLVDCIDRFINGKVNNLKGYLRLGIRSGLWEAARTDDVIQSPRNCPARQYHGKELTSYTKSYYSPDSDAALSEACQDEGDEALVAMLRAGQSIKSISVALMMTPEQLAEKAMAIGKRIRELL